MPDKPGQSMANNPPAATNQVQPKPQRADNKLIDLFESIEQTPMFANEPPQNSQQGYYNNPTNAQYYPNQNPYNGLRQPAPQQAVSYTSTYGNGTYQQYPSQIPAAQYSTNQMRPDFTGAGFGGYTPSANPSPSVGASPQISQNVSPASQMMSPTIDTTNPFRISMVGTPNPSYASFSSSVPQRSQSMRQPQQSPQIQPLYAQSTNPFAQMAGAQSISPPNAFSSPPQAMPLANPYRANTTGGSNPFARPSQPQQEQQQQRLPPMLTNQSTGSNPFRKSLMTGPMGFSQQQQSALPSATQYQ